MDQDKEALDLEAWPDLNNYLAHTAWCESTETEICSCGLREAKERGRQAYIAIRDALKSREESEARAQRYREALEDLEGLHKKVDRPGVRALGTAFVEERIAKSLEVLRNLAALQQGQQKGEQG